MKIENTFAALLIFCALLYLEVYRKGGAALAINNIILERQALTRSLDKLKNHRAVAVCAPAGYGKSTAISQWLKKDTRAKAVFSVDEYDNNVAEFCERFCYALLACQPRNSKLSEIAHHPSFRYASNEFAFRAVSALSSRKQAVLVIDDLHLITNDEVFRLLLIFLKRLPTCFQIILISRQDLPVGFSELWLKGHAARINAKQLLFSVNEIKALYRKRGNPITQVQANSISDQTLGWAMGINAFLLSGGESFDVICEHLSDFIEENIWKKWDDATRDFMLRTAALNELIPSLCKAVTGIGCSEELLEEFVQKGAFTSKLQNGVYRYHSLFRHFLKQKVSEQGKDFFIALLELEGNWHLSQNDFYNAIDRFIQCENHDGIAKCFEIMQTSGIENFSTSRFLAILNQSVVRDTTKKYPHLLYFLAYSSLAKGDRDDTIYFMDEYYNKCSGVEEGGLLITHNIIYMLFLDHRVSATRIPDMVVIPNNMTKIDTQKWSLSMHMPLLHRGVIDFSIEAELDVVDFMKSQMLAKTGWAYGDKAPLIIETIIAGLLYERGDLEKAHLYALQANAMIKEDFLVDTKLCAMYILVRILDAIGDACKVSEIMQVILKSIEDSKAYQLSPNYDAFVVRRKFMQGDIESAERWIDVHATVSPTFWGMYVSLTTCRAFILTEQYDSAIILLSKILEIARAFNRTHDIIDVQILLAIAYWKRKRSFQNKALVHLDAACRSAYPYGFTQMFKNEGAEISGMLYKLQKRVEQQEDNNKKHLSFIKMLYLQTNDCSDVIKRDKPEKIVKFTDKQKAIMHLICQGKKQKEITETLHIKQSTLRSHLDLIYNKLEVTNIMDAIKKINKLRLLDNQLL